MLYDRVLLVSQVAVQELTDLSAHFSFKCELTPFAAWYVEPMAPLLRFQRRVSC